MDGPTLELPAEIETASEEETEALGKRIAPLLAPGESVLLEGPLGAGKTVLCRGLCQGLGVDPQAVRSPSFNILLRYEGRVAVQHVDLYRLSQPEEAVEAGVEEALWNPEAITLVEWAERLRGIPCPPGLDLRLENLGADQRRVRVSRRSSE